MIVFDGVKLAMERELLLKEKIARNFAGKNLKIAAILFVEDAGSQLYTQLKSEAATRVGIEYEIHEFSLSDNPDDVISKIGELNNDQTVTGIIIQKPWRNTWVKARGASFQELIVQQSDPKKFERQEYNSWWGRLTSEISESKDVDGLHPNTIAQIKNGQWQENKKVLPATCRAVLTILDRAGETENFSDRKTVIIGRSDLLGTPLYFELLRRNSEAYCVPGLEEEGAKCEPNSDKKPKEVELIASKEFKARMESGQKLLDANIIVSATGRKNLVTGDMVSDNTVVIDAGEPRADVDFSSVAPKTIFITPVPGGVGPMTVVSLLENCVDLAS